MQKNELLQLLESEKRVLVKNINDKNSYNIKSLFESNEKDDTTNQSVPNRSTRPDMIEMDANNTKNGIYDVSIKETDNKNTRSNLRDVKITETPDSKTTENINTPIDGVKDEPTQNTSNNVVDDSSGYYEIELSEDLKNIDEDDLDDILTKSELDSILNADDDVKIPIFRNLLLTKKSDFGNSSEYECFTTGKGGAKMTKGKVPDAYITKYYTSTSEMIRPNTQESYLTLTAKLKRSEEELNYMQLPEIQKYIVHTTVFNDNSEYITVLDENQYNILFHRAVND